MNDIKDDTQNDIGSQVDDSADQGTGDMGEVINMGDGGTAVITDLDEGAISDGDTDEGEDKGDFDAEDATADNAGDDQQGMKDESGEGAISDDEEPMLDGIDEGEPASC